MNNDVGLKNAVEAELAWVPSVDAAHVGVTAENGIVTLSGHVPTYAQKLAVENAVKRIKGVRGLAEELEVRFLTGFGNDDDEVTIPIAPIHRIGCSNTGKKVPPRKPNFCWIVHQVQRLFF